MKGFKGKNGWKTHDKMKEEKSKGRRNTQEKEKNVLLQIIKFSANKWDFQSSVCSSVCETDCIFQGHYAALQ